MLILKKGVASEKMRQLFFLNKEQGTKNKEQRTRNKDKRAKTE